MKIFVDNLGYNVTEEFVRALFSRHGYVQKVWIIRTRLGSPHARGFVHMPDTTAAQTAIAELDGVEFGGAPLSVNAAHE